MKQCDYMVCVKCLTFNQASYVKDTLDGFCMQETTFPYVCAIIDDASTDGEQAVINDYLHANFDLTDNSIFREEDNKDYVLRYARHKNNNNCYFAVLFLKYNHYNKKYKDPYIVEWTSRSRYMALCEGDDYWTSKYKLQKQVDFLESHNNYVLTCHRYSIYDQEADRFESDGNDALFKNGEDLSFDLWVKKWITKTLSLVFRTEAAKEYYNYPGIKRDTVFVYFILKNGLGYCFNENMGVYRRSNNGVCGKKDNETNAMARLLIRKELYEYERNAFTRQMYYRFLFQAVFITRGKALKKIKFSLTDLFYLPYYLIKEINHLFFKRFI